jgi:hypothetical protein
VSDENFQIEGGQDPLEVLAWVARDAPGTTMIVYTLTGSECRCVRSCTAPCPCEPGEDGGMMAIQGLALKKNFKVERLPIAAINGAIYARENAGLGL